MRDDKFVSFLFGFFLLLSCMCTDYDCRHNPDTAVVKDVYKWKVADT